MSRTSMHLSRLRKWLAASPPAEYLISHVRELLINALRQGPIPQHVAFVMDGNRRFARRSHLETVEGHNLGFEALARVRVGEKCPFFMYKSISEVLTGEPRYWKCVTNLE